MTLRRVVWWGVAAGCAAAVVWQQPVRAAQPVADAAAAFAQRVVASGDNERLPFAVVDKRAALIVVHRADGSVAGKARALLGSMRGDHSTPGVGERAQRGELRPEDLTTPAGRFAAVPGVNHTGEAVVWIDHDAALAVHRLRPGPSHDERARRLASASPDDKRLSSGCVVVAASFYDGVVQPVLGQGRAVVYVLPDFAEWTVLWRSIVAARAG